MTMFVMTRVIFSVFYDDKSSARQAVEDGHAWGVIHFEEDFSTNLFKVCVCLLALVTKNGPALDW